MFYIFVLLFMSNTFGIDSDFNMNKSNSLVVLYRKENPTNWSSSVMKSVSFILI